MNPTDTTIAIAAMIRLLTLHPAEVTTCLPTVSDGAAAGPTSTPFAYFAPLRRKKTALYRAARVK
ncbi:MAG: hypothetical protein DWQ34_18565 [Planctomycetota bacterium]|nr:MAG: hypothetical protein DWQ34_18565 [Planctomycetota bacterium]REK21266.1 MAG: hypothetical protein DWQ41_21930 [Planctomycetota bacterium]REK32059.1 MAG: hypothetical protein DWQ45_18020 [Planctomycetota bacterium]